MPRTADGDMDGVSPEGGDMSEAGLRRWTLEEFLAWEERQPVKHEFVDGQVRLMTGVTQAHDRIVTNVVIALGGKLRGSPCRAGPVSRQRRGSGWPCILPSVRRRKSCSGSRCVPNSTPRR